jgi:glutathione S-transferase
MFDTSDAQPRRAPRYSRVDELVDESQPRAMWTWKKVAQATSGRVADLAHGPSCAQSRLRLFGASEKDVRVTLFRDHHAWCPYCQKIWLWLEEKRVPYRVKKVTMFCYGEKESWYKRVVPSGMLPAVELDGRIVTESDVILERLEATFGPLVHKMNDRDVVACRRLERHLFGAWCEWLCRPQRSAAAEQRSRAQFEAVADAVEDLLARRPGAFFLGDEFTTADVVFVPYVERMSASLFYYKGFQLRDPAARPRLCAWFDNLEKREAYLGTQSDFHTHCHDLPPQMGGCYESGDAAQAAARDLVDARAGGVPAETTAPVPDDAKIVAAARVAQFRSQIAAVNGELADAAAVDGALLAAVANLLDGGTAAAPPPGTAAALRYVKDRVNVPRDMPIHSARALCAALEATAALDSAAAPRSKIRLKDRRDQDPRPFQSAGVRVTA